MTTILLIIAGVCLALGLVAGSFIRRLVRQNRDLLAAANRPAPSAQQRRMMGLDTDGDKQVSVTVRDWEAMRRAIWRSMVGWEIAANQAIEIIDNCKHVEGCPGIESETEACLQNRRTVLDNGSELVEQGCPDREMRMSALVILTAARQYAPTDAKKPADGPYFAPSREYFSEVLSSLHAAQMENDRLRQASISTTPPAPKELE